MTRLRIAHISGDCHLNISGDCHLNNLIHVYYAQSTSPVTAKWTISYIPCTVHISGDGHVNNLIDTPHSPHLRWLPREPHTTAVSGCKTTTESPDLWWLTLWVQDDATKALASTDCYVNSFYYSAAWLLIVRWRDWQPRPQLKWLPGERLKQQRHLGARTRDWYPSTEVTARLTTPTTVLPGCNRMRTTAFRSPELTRPPGRHHPHATALSSMVGSRCQIMWAVNSRRLPRRFRHFLQVNGSVSSAEWRLWCSSPRALSSNQIQQYWHRIILRPSGKVSDGIFKPRWRAELATGKVPRVL